MKGLILLSFPLEIKEGQNKFATMMPWKTTAGIIKAANYPLFISQLSIKTPTFAARYKKTD
jgi:hypothetical protein